MCRSQNRATGVTWCPAAPQGNLEIPGYFIHCSEGAGAQAISIERLFWLRLISTQRLLLFTINVSILALFWCTCGRGVIPPPRLSGSLPDFVTIFSSFPDPLSQGWHLFIARTLSRLPAASRSSQMALKAEMAVSQWRGCIVGIPPWFPESDHTWLTANARYPLVFPPLSFPLSRYVISLSLLPPSHTRNCKVYRNIRY